MTLEFLEVCGPYEPVYEPFYAGFEKTCIQIGFIFI